MTFIKSPLRYPGGKSRAVVHISQFIPDFKSYREPFLGGGSVFVHLKQRYNANDYWINDFNKDLYLFWKICKEENRELVNLIRKIKSEYRFGKELYYAFRINRNDSSELEKAARFFILNRITFSGLIDSGGYSEQAFQNRFTESSIDRISDLGCLFEKTTITNKDYEYVVNKNGNDVFIYCDPPYFSTAKSKLYGKNGDLHKDFDHFRFAEVMKKCHHKWLVTYDDCEEIRSNFSFANIYSWTLQYGMNNTGHKAERIGDEVFISNYALKQNHLGCFNKLL